jgi:hypothetical protein
MRAREIRANLSSAISRTSAADRGFTVAPLYRLIMRVPSFSRRGALRGRASGNGVGPCQRGADREAPGRAAAGKTCSVCIDKCEDQQIAAKTVATGEAKTVVNSMAFISSLFSAKSKYGIKPEQISLLDLSPIERLPWPTAVWFAGRSGK